jgi:four helix bundle protein
MEIRKEEDVNAAAGRIRDFKELTVWQVARKLRSLIYRFTRGFPKEEAYGLTAQMRRAAVSITANLSEGFGRFSYQENAQFCRLSRASAYELRDHLTTALDENYLSKAQYEEAEKLAMDVIRLLNGYIRSTLKLQETPESKKKLRASAAIESRP